MKPRSGRFPRARSGSRAFTLADYEAARDGRAPKPKKEPGAKYRAKQAGGFASRKEARRADDLAAMERAGLISDLRMQVKFPFVINGHLVCSYVADFVYIEAGAEVVEDTKSPITRKNREYRIKVKLLKAVYGIDIRES